MNSDVIQYRPSELRQTRRCKRVGAFPASLRRISEIVTHAQERSGHVFG